MLSIFVRHIKACPALSKGLSPEKLRAYKHCDCPKWYKGTHEGRTHPRTTLNANSWEGAERALDKIKNSGPEAKAITMEKAVAAWLEEVAINQASASTTTQWKIITTKLLGFCQRKKILYIQNLGPEAINQWRAEWSTEKHHRGTGLKPNTANTRITVLRLLFKFARRMRPAWIKENPMDLIKVKSSADQEDGETHQTLPLDEEGDANYQKLLNIIPRYISELQRCAGAFTTHPKHFTALTKLMHETGLRWSDASRFDLGKMVVDPKDGWGAYTTKQMKTRRKGAKSLVTVGVPPWLVKDLQSLSPMSPRFLFWDEITAPSALYKGYANHIKACGERAGIQGVRAHRLRDSFAVNQLNNGFSIEEVSRLLGHTSIAVTERYYAPWVKSRKDALMAKRKALAGVTPVPAKVVPIKKHA